MSLVLAKNCGRQVVLQRLDRLCPGLFLSVWLGAAAQGGGVELFQDTGFAEGFGAAWSYGAQFAPAERGQGRVLAYRDIAPYQVRLIPDGPVENGQARAHPWDFEEGGHLNFTDEFGRQVAELHEHRLVVNHVIERNTRAELRFAQFNNYGLSADDPRRDTRLVKSVRTDREGNIRLYYNTSNEVRNIALSHHPRYATDIWPHLLLVQKFSGQPRLADFERLDFSLDYRVIRQRKLSEWPLGVPDGMPPAMLLQYYFQIRALTNANHLLFAGGVLHASDPALYRIHTALEQSGFGFHREPVFPPPELDRQQGVRLEVKALIRRALLAASSQHPALGLSTNPDDYYLSCFNIGWEGTGHWESECELSNLSLKGVPRDSTNAVATSTKPGEAGLRYHVEGDAIAIHNGAYFNNRPLYGSHGPRWVMTGDRPLVRFLGQGGVNGCWSVGIVRAGQGKWLSDWDDVTARYRSGRMEWTARDSSLPGVTVVWSVVAQAGREAYASKLEISGARPGDELRWIYGGVHSAAGVGEKFDPVWLLQFESDSGSKSPVLRQGFLPEACAGNIVTPRRDGFSIRAPGESAREVHARCAEAMEVKVADASACRSPSEAGASVAGNQPMAYGRMPLAGTNQILHWSFEADAPAYSATSAILADPEAIFRNASQRAIDVAARVVVETPEATLNAGVAAAGHALDSVFYPPVYRHGAMAWNLPFPGWRVLYGGTAFGWHDRVRSMGRYYVDSQEQGDALKTARSDPAFGLSQEAKDSRFYGRGRITRDSYFYNFQSQLFDQLIHAWRWTGDAEAEKLLRDGLELHLEWVKDCFDPDGDGLYESYINVWPTDSVWYNGGGSAEETAYAYRGHLAAADLARITGDSGREQKHRATAAKLQKALRDRLWIKHKGYVGSYIEQGGHGRRHEDSWLYSIFGPIDSGMLTEEEAVQSLHYTEWGLERVTLPYGGKRCWTSNFLPSMWSARELYPGDNYHLALAYFQTGLAEEGWELLRGNYLESMYAGVVPGGLACANGGTDFTDVLSMFGRTVVEGLFGFRPDYPNGLVHCEPQFPAAWPQAAIRTPDFSLRFGRSGNLDRYHLQLTRECATEFLLPVRASGVRSVEVNGVPAKWTVVPGFGQSRLRVLAPRGTTAEVVVNRKDSLPWSPPVEQGGSVGQKVVLPAARGKLVRLHDPQAALGHAKVRTQSATATLAANPGHHLVFGEVKVGSLRQYQVFKLNINDPAADAAQAAKTSVAVGSGARWQTVDIAAQLNADVRTIYQQQYVSPRPQTCSVRIGSDGYSPWTFYHWRFKPPVIDLAFVPAQLNAAQELVAEGVPFRWSGNGTNIAFTSLWDNWPKSVTVPVGGTADVAWLLICGSSNPMQTRIANGVVTFRYADGSTEQLELIPPTNYWSLCPLGNRDYTHPRDRFCLPKVLPRTVQLGNNCRAMVLPWKLKPDQRLESVSLESLSQEVVIGLMGITLMHEEGGAK